MVRREAHACSALCTDKGICQIDTAPQSIEATFTGRHETFQYTKVVFFFALRRAFLISYAVHTRCVESPGHGIVLTPIQLQNGCSALGPFRLDRCHMRGHTPIAKKTSHFTSARHGAWLLAYYGSGVLRRCSCESCGYFCTLPLGKTLL